MALEDLIIDVQHELQYVTLMNSDPMIDWENEYEKIGIWGLDVECMYGNMDRLRGTIINAQKYESFYENIIIDFEYRFPGIEWFPSKEGMREALLLYYWTVIS